MQGERAWRGYMLHSEPETDKVHSTWTPTTQGAGPARGEEKMRSLLSCRLPASLGLSIAHYGHMDRDCGAKNTAQAGTKALDGGGDAGMAKLWSCKSPQQQCREHAREQQTCPVLYELGITSPVQSQCSLGCRPGLLDSPVSHSELETGLYHNLDL